MTFSEARRRIPVWPYFFLSGLAAVFGTIFVVFWWPGGYPGKAELVKVSGDIKSAVIKDEISKTSAGALLPAMTAVYFTLEGVEGEFRYPSTHPSFPRVRDDTAAALHVWVHKSELGKNKPATIWQLHERNSRDSAEALTVISYEEVIERLSGSDRSVTKLGFWLLAASIGLLFVGLLIRRLNRTRASSID